MGEYTVLVTGGRRYFFQTRVHSALDALDKKFTITRIVQGGAKGADECARNWAKAHNVECVTYEADWDGKGRAAGHIRNAEMLKDSNPDAAVAFPGGPGTASMVKMLEKAGVPLWKVP